MNLDTFSPFDDIISLIENGNEEMLNGDVKDIETTFLEMRYYCPTNSSDLLKKSRKLSSRRGSDCSDFAELTLHNKLSHISSSSFENEIPEICLTRNFSSGPFSTQHNLQVEGSENVNFSSTAFSQKKFILCDFIVLFEEVMQIYLLLIKNIIDSQSHTEIKLSIYCHLVLPSLCSGQSSTSHLSI